MTDICRGPIEGGRCRWCGRMDPGAQDHEMCDQEWPDRPRHYVHPKFMQVPVTIVKVECWQCGEVNMVNTLNQPDIARQLMADGVETKSHCMVCGAGMDIVKAKIIQKPGQLYTGK